MRKTFMVGLAALATATSANAATLTAGYTTGAEPSYTTATPFETFAKAGSPAAGAQYNPATQSSGNYAETVSGSVPAFAASDQNPGIARDSTAVGNFLSVEANSSFGVNFGAGVQFFSFAFGTLDAYNLLTLTVGGSTVSYTGTQLAAISGGAVTTNGGTADQGRFYFDAGGGAPITAALFSSSSNSFEFNSLASAAPEPATWALMILGFGLVGSQLRSRRRMGLLSLATA